MTKTQLLFSRLISLPCLVLGAGNALACEEGVWELSSMGVGPDQQTFVNPATSIRYCLFDGALEMDEFRALSPDGQVIFRGVSFNYDSGNQKKTLWVMVGDPGHTLITANLDDGVLVSEGTGADGYGNFLETSQTTFDDERGYVFIMNRSYDGGENWIAPFNRIDATLVASDAPPLPQTLASPVSEAAAVTGESGTPILDGYAEIEEIETDSNGVKTRSIRFSSLYAPDSWRDLQWTLGSREISSRSTPIGLTGDSGQ